jgi:chemotaxis protein methyltransferase CheR
MIYFDQAARRRVLQGIYRRLVPGGFLFLGHSESLINTTADFELVHLRHDVAYRRPLVAGPGTAGDLGSGTA